MNYNLISNLESCYVDVPSLLYYSHIPSAVIVVLLGLFVLFKSKENRLAGKILFSISILFFVWVTVEGALWLIYSSLSMMSLWSFLGLLYVLMHVLGVYFVYAVVDKKDISMTIKFILLTLLLPIIILTPTVYNLTGYDYDNCQALEGSYFIGYRYFLGAVSILWILALLFNRYRKADGEIKKQILYIGAGMTSFLLLFSWSEIVGSLTESFEVTQYGLFGMPIFVGFLAFLIVRYRFFNIKLLGAQALVISLVGLVASEFFFIPLENTTNVVLISVTVLLSTVFGIFLVRSVKMEVQRKEELQDMSNKLAQANDQLRKLDNAKSEFISIASHQLRTPLTAVKGFVSLLLEGSYGKITAKQQDVLNKVYTSNERLVTLVEDLLNISRIESGRMEFKYAPTDIVGICQEVSDTLLMKAKGRKLDLDWKAPEVKMPELMIDGTKVREVISNMVDNAVKYTEKGGVKVRVEMAESSRYLEAMKSQNPDKKDFKGIEGEVVRVVVSDTGIGIPAEELPYLFSKFSRGKDTSRLNTGGTGLGLYVGKAMIEENGGRIWAESDGAGRGSRFLIELPVSQDEELMKKWG